MKNETHNKRVTICTCTSRSFIDKDKVAETAAVLQREGYAIRLEADLCRKATEAPDEMRDIAAGAILACYPRAVLSLFHWLGIDAGQAIDIRNGSCEEILSSFGIPYPCPETTILPGKEKFRETIGSLPAEEGTDAWYPLIDKARCTECGKCHDFCLFGVYTVANGKVRVAQPQNCKNNCPACARMCPGQAIIFPKYERSPVNGGLAQEESFDPEAMDALYREKLQMRLRQRRNSVSLVKDNDK